MAMHDAAVGCWETKYFYFNPRPDDARPERQDRDRRPQLPGLHLGALDLLGRRRGRPVATSSRRSTAEFDAARDEASISRLYGSIHYRSDIEAGKDHGKRIGGYTIKFAREDGAD